MKAYRVLLYLALVFLASETCLGVSISSLKVTPSLKTSLESKGIINILVFLKDDTSKVLTDLKGTLRPLDHNEKSQRVQDALKSHTLKSQGTVLETLRGKLTQDDFSTRVKSFWISNQIYIRNADASLIEVLGEMDQVSRIIEEPVSKIENVLLSTEKVTKGDNDRMLADWGVERMRVPEVWSMPNGGFNGTGLIVGTIDTGVRGSHELLREKWLGPLGGWFDPADKSDFPNDGFNHGTHTMGTLVGGDGMGVAPGAKWTSCKNFQQNQTIFASIAIECGQFLLCPTDTSGNNPDCSKTPHIISNSWAFGSGDDFFNPIIDAWNAAGILSSFSVGNAGEILGCGSTTSPSDQPNAIGVGASGKDDEVAFFSGLGPSPYGEIKPEIIAPGIDIYSSSSEGDDAYILGSGTSMACPNLAGVLALMKSADLNLTYESAKEILKQSASQNVTTVGVTCGGVADSVFPNNNFGYGIVDAYVAVQMVLNNKLNL